MALTSVCVTKLFISPPAILLLVFFSVLFYRWLHEPKVQYMNREFAVRSPLLVARFRAFHRCRFIHAANYEIPFHSTWQPFNVYDLYSVTRISLSIDLVPWFCDITELIHTLYFFTATLPSPIHHLLTTQPTACRG